MRVFDALQSLLGDVRLATRRLLAAPVFTIFAVLSLGIGVAITTAVHSVVDALFLADLGIRDPEEVAFVVAPHQGRLLTGTISEPDFRDLRAAQTSFGRISATLLFHPAVTSASATERVSAEAVDGEYFATLGVTAAIGRVILPADDDERARVAVLSDTLWRTRFRADPRIVGQLIRISGEPFEVIGVIAGSFDGVNGWLGGTQLWIPLASESARTALVPAPATAREQRRLVVFGRLGPSVTLPRASAELAAIASRLDAVFPSPRATGPGLTERPWTLKSIVAITEDDNPIRRFGLVLVLLVSLVLAVACTNLANLVLARGAGRQKELAVRRALGASRWRLLRELCLESLILAIAGGVAAYLVFHGVRLLMQADINFAFPPFGRLTLSIRPVLNVEAISVAVAALLISLVVFGLEPAWQLTGSADVRGALAAGSAVGIPRSRRQQLLLRWQVAISAGFFIVATMFVRYTIAELRHDSGIDLERLGVALLNLDRSLWDEPRARRVIDRLIEEVQRNSEIEAVSVSSGLPFGAPVPIHLSVRPPDVADINRGDRDRNAAIVVAATPSIFRTLGVPIVRGRGFDDRDHAASERVVVLSEYGARQIFGTVDAVGRALVVRGQRPGESLATVIGVAGDTDVGRLLNPSPRALVYLPLAQRYEPLIAVVARGASASRAVRGLQESIRRVDPDLAIEVIGTGRRVLAGPFEILRGLGMSAIILGGVTLTLAMAGLFGIQSRIVAHRTREIGVRMSIGATSTQIKRMVLRDGYRPVIEGLGLGLFMGLVGRAIAREYMEIDVSIVDPWMLVITPIPLTLAAYCACYLPARRAAGVDPNVALRQE